MKSILTLLVYKIIIFRLAWTYDSQWADITYKLQNYGKKGHKKGLLLIKHGDFKFVGPPGPARAKISGRPTPAGVSKPGGFTTLIKTPIECKILDVTL